MEEKIFVLIEHILGEVADISYTLLAAANQVAQTGTTRVIALLLGHENEQLAQTLAADQDAQLANAGR